MSNRKSVLVTGAAGGVGRRTVQRLQELGWQVFAGVRQRPDDVPAGELVELDITDAVSVDRAVGEITRRLGGRGLDGLVNNAGLSVDGPVELVPIEALRRQFEVNLIGQVAVTQALLPLVRRARGRVVNIGGAAGRLTVPMYGALSASKAALEAITNALRMELRHQGVAVVYVEPGALRTPLFAKSARAASRDRAGVAPERERIYTRAIAASSAAMRSSPAGPVDKAVDAIVRALNDRNPAARYPVGREPRVLLPILRKLPISARDRLVMHSMGLRRDVFTGQRL
jgi:NAD(P)-dependent dehydrogenase (short-subunit alcohol dehydrogenase family)